MGTALNREIWIAQSQDDTQVALVEEGKVLEVFVEHQAVQMLRGNIYVGKVSRVVPALQSAFVDIGLEKMAFLHVTEVVSENGHGDEQSHQPIQKLLHEGQSVMVQVTREGVGQKGPRATMNITLASRYLVLMPRQEQFSLSKKISDEQESERLRDLLPEVSGSSGLGLIARTVAEGKTREVLEQEFDALVEQWDEIESAYLQDRTPRKIHEDLPVALRTLRDLLDHRVGVIRVDDSKVRSDVAAFIDQFGADFCGELHEVESSISSELESNLAVETVHEKRVNLPSGGYIVIEKTEAMTTVDVNSGGNLGQKNLSATALQTNLEATVAISRHLRLRNIGGLIVVDFIDMASDEDEAKVASKMQELCASDRLHCQVSDMLPFGLLAISRSRVGLPLDVAMDVAED